jgi:hypothetical protein
MQNQTKEEPDQCLQGIMVHANCEKEPIKMINDDPENAVGEARQERVLFLEEIVGVFGKMEH